MRLDEIRKDPRHEAASDDAHNYVGGLIELIQFAKPKSVIEIGSHHGVSTEAFLILCEQVFAVDYWPSGREHFDARCLSYPNLWVVRGKSPEVLDQFGDETFDLCYIDADHDYEAVVKDIRACKRLVKAGGWLAGHDYAHEDVRNAVQAALGPVAPRIFQDTSWLLSKAECRGER